MSKVSKFSANGKPVYVTSTGKVRLGTRGKFLSAQEILQPLSKSERRRLRKAAREAGHLHVCRS